MRNLTSPIVAFVVVSVLVLPALLLHADDPVDGKFDAVAEVTGPQGTRSMPVTIEVRQPMPLDQAAGLRDVLAKGGQQALVNAIRGANRGSFMLGAVQYPVDLVIAEPADEGWKYAIVTVRNFQWNETELNEPSLDFPFTVAVFEVPGMGRGEGQIMPRAALSIGEDGRVVVDKFQGTSGRLKDVKRR